MRLTLDRLLNCYVIKLIVEDFLNEPLLLVFDYVLLCERWLIKVNDVRANLVVFRLHLGLFTLCKFGSIFL